jgi:hypothetical protein
MVVFEFENLFEKHPYIELVWLDPVTVFNQDLEQLKDNPEAVLAIRKTVGELIVKDDYYIVIHEYVYNQGEKKAIASVVPKSLVINYTHLDYDHLKGGQ